MQWQGMSISEGYMPIDKDEPGNTESPLDNEIIPPNEQQKETMALEDGIPQELKEFVNQFMPFGFQDGAKKPMKKKKMTKKTKKTKLEHPETIIEEPIGKPVEIEFNFDPNNLPSVPKLLGSMLDMVLPEFPDVKPTTPKPEVPSTPEPLPQYPKPTKTNKRPSIIGDLIHTVVPLISMLSPLSQVMSMFTPPKPMKPTPKPTPEPTHQPEYHNIFSVDSKSDHKTIDPFPTFSGHDLHSLFQNHDVHSSVHDVHSPVHDIHSSVQAFSPLTQFMQIISHPKPAPTQNVDADFPLPDFIMDIMRQASAGGDAPWKIHVGDAVGDDGEMIVNIEPAQKGVGIGKTMVFNVPLQMPMEIGGNDEELFNILDFL